LLEKKLSTQIKNDFSYNNGEQLMLNAALLVTGYTHKFMLEFDGQTIIFESDEERNYRAIVPYDDIDKNKPIGIELLKAIT
jgi:hypothetical protein